MGTEAVEARVNEETVTMNSLERYKNMLDGKPVDILPRIPIVMQFAAEYIGSNYGAFASDYRVLMEANEACARDFGFDQLSCISDPYRETQGFGAEIEYVKDGVPRSTHPLEHDKDMTRLATPDPLKSERMLDRVEAVRAYKAKHGGEYSILGWVEGPAAEAANLRNVSTFLMDLMTDELYACGLMDCCLKTAIAFARAQVEAGADTIGIGDAIASQVSPDTYERLIQPREKKLVQAIQDMGAYVRLHICGDITHLLPGISELKVDILDVDHMVSLSNTRKALGDKIVLAGNMDPVEDIRHGTPEAIQRSVAECYKAAGKPYMVNAGCEIPAGTPEANLKALCQGVPS